MLLIALSSLNTTGPKRTIWKALCTTPGFSQNLATTEDPP